LTALTAVGGGGGVSQFKQQSLCRECRKRHPAGSVCLDKVLRKVLALAAGSGNSSTFPPISFSPSATIPLLTSSPTTGGININYSRSQMGSNRSSNSSAFITPSSSAVLNDCLANLALL
jgi:hypothetical protein